MAWNRSEAALPLAVPPPTGSDLEAGCDFYCLRFRVWYPSVDCALRTRYKTCNGCLRCDQGRFNLRRHAALVERMKRRPVALR